MRAGEVWATRDDGALLIYDADDEYGRALGHIRLSDKDYSQHPVIALLARGGWKIGETPAVTAAGDSWRWQLRDKNGKWIEMGSEVKWLARAQWLKGIVEGSPSPGVANVREDKSHELRSVATNRLEVVESASEQVPSKRVARAKVAEDPVYDWLQRSRLKDWESIKPWTASQADIAAGRLPGFTLHTTPSGSDAMWRSGEDVWIDPKFFATYKTDDMRRSSLYHEAGHAIANALNRDQDAWEKTLAPFRRNNRKLASPFSPSLTDPHDNLPEEMLADAYAALMTGYADVWTKNAMGGASETDMRQLFDEVRRVAAALGFPTVPASTAVIAAGDSWRWQLRDKNGKWIEMGSEVKWLAKGRWLHGIVVGSPAPGVASVEEALTEILHDIPSARLEVVRDAAGLIERVEAARDEKGRIDWRRLDLDARSALPAEVTTSDPTLPQQITAGDLRPGDVFRRYDGNLIRVIALTGEPNFDYTDIDGIVLTGDNAGARTQMAIQKKMTVLRQSAGEQDFEKDVLAPVRERLDALKAKYPDGMATAIDVALTMASAEPFKSNPRFDELGRDPEVVRWMYQSEDALARWRAAREADPYSPETKRLEDETASLMSHTVGGKILEYDKLLIEHRKAYLAWQMKNESATNVITPHSDQAKEILGEVREIGRMVRLGIDVDIAQRNVPPAERAPLELRLKNLEAEKSELVAERIRLTSEDPEFVAVKKRLSEVLRTIGGLELTLSKMPDSAVDSEYAHRNMSSLEKQQRTEWKRRRELTRRTVATLAGTTTETKQTWVSKDPATRIAAGEVHRALTKEEQDAMTAGLLAYPASWVERFDQNIYTTSMSKRGWHTETERHITLSMYDEKTPSDDGAADVWSTIFHEEGHGMEQVVPGLSGLEAMFWHDRMGEKSQKRLHSEDGARFPDGSEMAGPTANISKPTPLRYTLKVYGNVYSKKQKSWEVFTTGVEEVLGTGKTRYTRDGDDSDLWDFTMGALLTLDGREKRG